MDFLSKKNGKEKAFVISRNDRPIAVVLNDELKAKELKEFVEESTLENDMKYYMSKEEFNRNNRWSIEQVTVG